MAFVRVATFEDVDAARIAELKASIEGGERPNDLPATEVIILHDAAASRSMALIFFDSEDDYAKGDAVLGAMPAEETPGKRTSLAKYEVGVRATT